MKLTFERGYCETVTASGKKAQIYQNEFNLGRACYMLYVDDEKIFTRGTIQKVMEMLRKL